LHPYSFLITSNFTSLSDAWLPTLSKFKFSDNLYDAKPKYGGKNQYGTTMFFEFEQGVKKTVDCASDCNNEKYLLQPNQ